MGQKTNPRGFRLITTQQPLSCWYTSTKYPALAAEDAQIRLQLETKLSHILELSDIIITRTIVKETNKENVEIEIGALHPIAKDAVRKLNALISEEEDEKLTPEDVNNLSAFLFGGKKSKKVIAKDLIFLLVKKEVRDILRNFTKLTGKAYAANIKFIRNQFTDARLIAKFIAAQLEKRTPFRRAMKIVIKKARAAGLDGIKIEISGRLNGADIARSEWKRSGQVPLHNLSAKIDYTHYIAQTVYGTIGIKIWLLLS